MMLLKRGPRCFLHTIAAALILPLVQVHMAFAVGELTKPAAASRFDPLDQQVAWMILDRAIPELDSIPKSPAQLLGMREQFLDGALLDQDSDDAFQRQLRFFVLSWWTYQQLAFPEGNQLLSEDLPDFTDQAWREALTKQIRRFEALRGRVPFVLSFPEQTSRAVAEEQRRRFLRNMRRVFFDRTMLSLPEEWFSIQIEGDSGGASEEIPIQAVRPLTDCSYCDLSAERANDPDVRSAREALIDSAAEILAKGTAAGASRQLQNDADQLLAPVEALFEQSGPPPGASFESLEMALQLTERHVDSLAPREGIDAQAHRSIVNRYREMVRRLFEKFRRFLALRPQRIESNRLPITDPAWVAAHNRRMEMLDDNYDRPLGFAINAVDELDVLEGRAYAYTLQSYLVFQNAQQEPVILPMRTEGGRRFPAVYRLAADGQSVEPLSLDALEAQLGLTPVVDTGGQPLVLKGFQYENARGESARVVTLPGPFVLNAGTADERTVAAYRYKGTGVRYSGYENQLNLGDAVEGKNILILGPFKAFSEGFGFAGREEQVAMDWQAEIREAGGIFQDWITDARQVSDQSYMSEGYSVASTLRLSEASLQHPGFLRMLQERYQETDREVLIYIYLSDLANMLGNNTRAALEAGYVMNLGANERDNFGMYGEIVDTASFKPLENEQQREEYIAQMQAFLKVMVDQFPDVGAATVTGLNFRVMLRRKGESNLQERPVRNLVPYLGERVPAEVAAAFDSLAEAAPDDLMYQRRNELGSAIGDWLNLDPDAGSSVGPLIQRFSSQFLVQKGIILDFVSDPETGRGYFVLDRVADQTLFETPLGVVRVAQIAAEDDSAEAIGLMRPWKSQQMQGATFFHESFVRVYPETIREHVESHAPDLNQWLSRSPNSGRFFDNKDIPQRWVALIGRLKALAQEGVPIDQEIDEFTDMAINEEVFHQMLRRITIVRRQSGVQRTEAKKDAYDLSELAEVEDVKDTAETIRDTLQKPLQVGFASLYEENLVRWFHLISGIDAKLILWKMVLDAIGYGIEDDLYGLARFLDIEIGEEETAADFWNRLADEADNWLVLAEQDPVAFSTTARQRALTLFRSEADNWMQQYRDNLKPEAQLLLSEPERIRFVPQASELTASINTLTSCSNCLREFAPGENPTLDERFEGYLKGLQNRVQLRIGEGRPLEDAVLEVLDEDEAALLAAGDSDAVPIEQRERNQEQWAAIVDARANEASQTGWLQLLWQELAAMIRRFSQAVSDQQELDSLFADLLIPEDPNEDMQALINSARAVADQA